MVWVNINWIQDTADIFGWKVLGLEICITGESVFFCNISQVFLVSIRIFFSDIITYDDLKGLFTNFEYITFFSCPPERNIFYKRFISIKPLWLEIIEKRGCTKSVRPSTIIYYIYITRTDFVHPFLSIISSQSGFIEMNLL